MWCCAPCSDVDTSKTYAVQRSVSWFSRFVTTLEIQHLLEHSDINYIVNKANIWFWNCLNAAPVTNRFGFLGGCGGAGGLCTASQPAWVVGEDGDKREVCAVPSRPETADDGGERPTCSTPDEGVTTCQCVVHFFANRIGIDTKPQGRFQKFSFTLREIKCKGNKKSKRDYIQAKTKAFGMNVIETKVLKTVWRTICNK